MIIMTMSITTYREFAENSLYTSGHSIAKRSLELSEELGEGWATFIVQIEENVFVENDPTKTCKNYPNSDFRNYNDCDKDFIQNILASDFGLELFPSWQPTVRLFPRQDGQTPPAWTWPRSSTVWRPLTAHDPAALQDSLAGDVHFFFF